MKNFLCLLVILGAAFGASALGLHSTAAGVRHAATGAPDTFIMQGKDLIVFAWSHGRGYAFAVFQEQGDLLKDLSQFRNATVCNTTEMVGFAKYLESHGYQYITPDKLPPWIAAAISSWKMYLLAAGNSVTFPFFVILPVAIIDHPAWLAPEVMQ